MRYKHFSSRQLFLEMKNRENPLEKLEFLRVEPHFETLRLTKWNKAPQYIFPADYSYVTKILVLILFFSGTNDETLLRL